MKHLILSILLFALPLFTSVTGTDQKKEPGVTPKINQQGPSLHDRIYFFQHRLLPGWTFNSDGAFYKDLMSGSVTRVKAAATEMVSHEFAEGISVKTVGESNGVLITFPKPDNVPDCYFVFIRQVDNKFMYITYEKTMNIADEGFAGAVCGWSSEGKHSNYGFQKYTDPDSFVSDALEIK
ncbi:MAG: hypothetical protein JW927_08185 [Deltaproteobacteria bacterium]|nr:hypothetical protein [Deltaproteobacteria bacterium]